MSIANVSLSNTFNEFRQSFNEAITVINAITDGNTSGDIVNVTNVISSNIISSSILATNLNQNRLIISGSGGYLTDDSELTFNPTTNLLTVNSVSITSTQDAANSISGALVVAGGVGIGGKLRVSANTHIEGNLFVTGNTVTFSSNNIALQDTFIYLNDGSTISNPDLGFAGNYNDGSYKHAGLFRDATDGKWKFFDSYTPEPTDPINISHGSFSLADVAMDNLEASTLTLSGNITVNTNKFNVTASSGNTSIAGTLSVTDEVSFSNNLNINTNKFNVTASSGNTAIAGTLSVTDEVSFSNNLNVLGTTTLSNTTINGTLSLTTLSITGNTILGDASNDNVTINGSTLSLGTNLNVNAGKFYFDVSNTRIGINTSTPNVSFHINTTDGLRIPVGTTGERPSGVLGTMRYNTTDNRTEIYDGSAWVSMGSSAGVSQAFAYFIAG